MSQQKKQSQPPLRHPKSEKILLRPDAVKLVPQGLDDELLEESEYLAVCVYGKPSAEVQAWIDDHGFVSAEVGKYTNIAVTAEPGKPWRVDDVFAPARVFDYMDGFSPNLNKHLHVGHASNLVLAKAFVGLGIADQTIAILGDTLQGDVSKDDAVVKFLEYCERFGYRISDRIYYASDMKLKDGYGVPALIDGVDKYAGTKHFDVDGEPVVGIKSDGSTTYFYQDVCLAELLEPSSVLYLTGSEQSNHFRLLKKLYPNIEHLGLGLVKANGQKMASRKGNVIMFEEVLDMLREKFDGDDKLCYNVLAGFILRSAPKSEKNIDTDMLDNPLNSPGLYLSYTLAKLKSAGCLITASLWGRTYIATGHRIPAFSDIGLQFTELRAQHTLQPNILFDALVEHARKISRMYEDYRIVGNEENKNMFEKLGNDLLLGMYKLGMFDVDRVKQRDK